MQRSWKRAIMAAPALLAAAVFLECRLAAAESPGPREQVKKFIKAAAAMKINEAAGCWVPEKKNEVRSILKSVPSGTRMRISKLNVSTSTQTEHTAHLSVYYVIETKTRSKVAVSEQEDRRLRRALVTGGDGIADFCLKKANNEWLIFDSSIGRKFGPWKAPPAVITPSDIKASRKTLADAARAIKTRDADAFMSLFTRGFREQTDNVPPDLSSPQADKLAEALLRARMVKTLSPDLILYEITVNGPPTELQVVNEGCGNWKMTEGFH